MISKLVLKQRKGERFVIQQAYETAQPASSRFCQQTFDALNYENMPALLKPTTGALGLMDFEKVFCKDHKGRGDIFEMRGIDRDQGCMIVVRPDQYIAHVLPLAAYEELAAFFEGFMFTVE